MWTVNRKNPYKASAQDVMDVINSLESGTVSLMSPACWSASLSLCLTRIATFFTVAPSESRGPLTQNKLNYSYVTLAADWLYFWRWYLNQLNAAYQTWRKSGFLQLHCEMLKNIITEHAGRPSDTCRLLFPCKEILKCSLNWHLLYYSAVTLFCSVETDSLSWCAADFDQKQTCVCK